jgi:putative oxidoreductase
VVVNIFFFHLFLAPEGLPLAIAIVALELFLTFQYRTAFEGVFSSPALQ